MTKQEEEVITAKNRQMMAISLNVIDSMIKTIKTVAGHCVDTVELENGLISVYRDMEKKSCVQKMKDNKC